MNSKQLLQQAIQIIKQDGFAGFSRQVVSRYRRKGKYWAANSRYTTFGSDKVPFRSPAGTIKLYVDPNWPAIGKYAAGETYEPILMDELTTHIDSDDIFYNIGARWGIFSLLVAKNGVPSEQIHSFEGDIDTYCRLVRNLSKLDTYHYHGFVSNKCGPSTITLDSYSKQHSLPTVLKIDVEGSEGSVLRGADKILADHPVLYIEMHPQMLSDKNDSQTEVISKLQEFDYDIQICLNNRDDQSKWQPIDKCDLPQGSVDYLIKAEG